MHAIRLHEFGPAGNLRFEEVPDPTPGPGQVRIAVAASGVHVVDTAIRSGTPPGPFPLPDLPAIPGREVAGTVDAVGEGVDPGWVGKRVVAHLGTAGAGYAERAVAPLAALHLLPRHVSEESAVAMIGTGRTTMGLLEIAGLTAEDVVLVLAAAGGIGTLLVQAAQQAGATVVGAAGGAEKTAVVSGLGADVVVDYTAPGWPGLVARQLDGRPVTVVFDAVGGPLARDALTLLGAGGRVIVYGWSGDVGPTGIDPGDPRGLVREIALRPGRLENRALESASLGALFSGRLRPVVGTRLPLARAADAHAAIEGRATIGKTVLVSNLDRA